ncbi:family 1 encapsulin nanocompartment shell protein [Sciscionella marina]|uniref:family 1 encapsulin nanocompartment shell protein n=1 Tax=Sciscionella marina TaxID=508770 RepID=UPI00035D716F|nr:family 1 encapsulin nanocompartment shell protein [Sciscionella marina]
MNHLLRELAPIPQAAWDKLEEEAKDQFTVHLAGRRLVDWSGPHGWEHSATGLGRKRVLEPEHQNRGDIELHRRKVLELAEVRLPFAVNRSELDDAERGAGDLDLDALDAAALHLARLENHAVFHGWREAGFTGMTAASPHRPVPLGSDPQNYPKSTALAVNTLRDAGVPGPYALAVGPRDHMDILAAAEQGGYPVLDHLRRILGGGKVVRAPGIEVAVVLGLGAGNFLFDVGQDISIGYEGHDRDFVRFYFEENFCIRVVERSAAVALARE